MAKKKVEVFVNIYNEQQFVYMLNHNRDRLICADIYNSFSGPCTALDYLFVRIKLDWTDGEIVLLRVLIDEIHSLSRFHGHSDPVFLFIMNRKITRIFRGVDNIKFAQAAKYEIECFKQFKNGIPIERVTYDLNEASPEELEWHKERVSEKQQEQEQAEERRMDRQAARKRHRAELMVPHLQHLNFVLYWPHAIHAHPELYERWDENNIIMVGREEIQLTKEVAYDILYAGDAELNEASLYRLLCGPALAICFRLLDTDKHFVCNSAAHAVSTYLDKVSGWHPRLVYVLLTDSPAESLVRKILYEEITPVDESKPLEDQHALMTAYDAYKLYSPSRDEILQRRREERIKKKKELIEKRARRLSEMQRLARQAIEDAIQAKRAAKEQRKLDFLKSGNLQALEKLKQEPDNDEVDIVVPDALSDVEEEEESDFEDVNEYFPPPGLVVPGFYAPPNDIAKTNGLAILFPRLVLEHVTPEPEFLPPHVLVMMNMDKRYKAVAAVAKYNKQIIHMGIFRASCPFNAIHVAYSLKQFEVLQKRKTYKLDKLRLALMVAVENDLALLELVDIGPAYVSRDATAGEVECAALFSVQYGDDYPQFEDFE